jgi:hypothetical protein
MWSCTQICLHCAGNEPALNRRSTYCQFTPTKSVDCYHFQFQTRLELFIRLPKCPTSLPIISQHVAVKKQYTCCTNGSNQPLFNGRLIGKAAQLHYKWFSQSFLRKFALRFCFPLCMLVETIRIFLWKLRTTAQLPR